MYNKILLPKNDMVFQGIFGKVGNEKIAQRFIELIIGEEIESIDLDVNKELLKRTQEDKLGRLDLRAKLNEGISCNIEIQLKNEGNMEKRAVYYWARLHGNQLKEGEGYKKVQKTISIIIMGENLKCLKDIKDYHTKFQLREENRRDLILSEDEEVHILELEKMKQTNNKKDELRLWLLFLDNPENEEVQKGMEENKLLKQAMEEYDYLRGDELFWRIVELREKNLRDEISARENAIDEGREEEKKDIAQKMLKRKFSIEEVAKITELPEDEIIKIKEKIETNI